MEGGGGAAPAATGAQEAKKTYRVGALSNTTFNNRVKGRPSRKCQRADRRSRIRSWPTPRPPSSWARR